MLWLSGGGVGVGAVAQKWRSCDSGFGDIVAQWAEMWVLISGDVLDH